MATTMRPMGLQERAALQARFVALWERHVGLVASIVAAGRVDDKEALVAEVALKSWRSFGATVAREAARIEEGGPAYNWTAWFARSAERVVLDARKRGRRARAAVGVRAMASREGAEEEVAALDVDAVVDQGAIDLLVRVERRAVLRVAKRVLGELGPVVEYVVARWLAGEPDERVAQTVGMPVKEVAVLREVALAQVRQEVVGARWEGVTCGQVGSDSTMDRGERKWNGGSYQLALPLVM